MKTKMNKSVFVFWIVLLLFVSIVFAGSYNFPIHYKGLSGIAPKNSLSLLKSNTKVVSVIIKNDGVYSRSKQDIAKQKARDILGSTKVVNNSSVKLYPLLDINAWTKSWEVKRK